MVLPQSFYNRPTLTVAQELLGCFLFRRQNRNTIKAMIVETEAYNGPHDLASHASRGKTPRNLVMYGPPGLFYVYFTYGLHYLLNIVTGQEGYPAAVLIRAAETHVTHNTQHITRDSQSKYLENRLSGNNIIIEKTRKKMATNGPAKLTEYLHIDKKFNGLPCFEKKYGLWVESGNEKIKKSNIIKTKRIGVDYAGEYKDKKWRFFLRDNNFVSKK